MDFVSALMQKPDIRALGATSGAGRVSFTLASIVAMSFAHVAGAAPSDVSQILGLIANTAELSLIHSLVVFATIIMLVTFSL